MDALTFFSTGSGIVTLCGSTKFFFEAMECNRLLTFHNWIVLQCGSWGHSFNKYSEATNTDFKVVKLLHYQKILQSQAIVVVSDSSDYIGSSTRAEIEFAIWRNIPRFYFDGSKLSGKSANPSIDNLKDYSLIEQFGKTNNLGF